MRLLLDANLSPRGVASPLRKNKPDVLALAEYASYEGLPGPEVLELAAAEQRILTTRNSRDFAPLARQWTEAQRSHAGLMLVRTLDHSQFAEIVDAVERELSQRPTQEQWQGITAAF